MFPFIVPMTKRQAIGLAVVLLIFVALAMIGGATLWLMIISHVRISWI